MLTLPAENALVIVPLFPVILFWEFWFPFTVKFPVVVILPVHGDISWPSGELRGKVSGESLLTPQRSSNVSGESPLIFAHVDRCDMKCLVTDTQRKKTKNIMLLVLGEKIMRHSLRFWHTEPIKVL